MRSSLDDEATLCSVEILAEAVEMAFVPGILELRTNAMSAAPRSADRGIDGPRRA